jgi:hypothetical protein
MGSPLVSGDFVRLLDKRLREVADQQKQFRDLEAMIPKFYAMSSSDRAFEEFFSVSQIGDIPKFTGKLSYLPRYGGFLTKVEHAEFAGGIQSERKLIDDEQYGVLEGNASGLMDSAARTKEKQGVRVFSNAFSAAFDFMTSEEGKPLCSSTHLSRSGAATSVGFSNAGTSALNKTSLAATRILMKQFRTDIGERFQTSEKYAIVVPSALESVAWELINTEKGYQTAHGDKNREAAIGYQIIEYPRLDDYDTNNWFLVDVESMKKSLGWYDRVSPEYDHTIDFETKVIKHSVYFRCSYGWKDWRWVYGHAVA